MIVLIPIDGNGEDGTPVQFRQRQIHVGRGAHNDLVLDQNDPAASYEHAQLTVLDSRAVVFCDPTANPTYIDGADVSAAPEPERQLRPGDVISFGKGTSIFRVHRIGDAEEARRPVPEKPRILLPSRKHGYAQPGETPPPPPPPPPASVDRGPGGGPCAITVQLFKDDQMVRAETFNQPLIRIGRMRSSHLLLDDESVSRTHAVIEVTSTREVLLMDLDSSSGTAVNGVRIKKAILKPGDRIEFGKAVVLLSYGSPAAGPPPPTARELPAPRVTSAPPPVPREPPPGPKPSQAPTRSQPEAADGPRILIRRGGVAQDSIVLTKPETSIGRLPDNDIQLDDGAVSGRHALLVAEAGLFLIVDQHSTNGVYLNGEKCNGETLKDGDIIQIGRFELVFIAPPDTPAPKAPKTEILSPEAAREMFAKLGGRRGNKP